MWPNIKQPVNLPLLCTTSSHRNATHSQVVHLLRSSGPHPIFVVCSTFASSDPLHGAAMHSSDTSDMRTGIRNFKDKVRWMLSYGGTFMCDIV